MSVFLWPLGLGFLVLLPLLIAVYRQGLKPPAKLVAFHSGVQLLAQVKSGGYQRHLPALFYLLACTLALVALARPTLPVLVADPLAGIILALDTSRSMQQQDIEPSRFEAAREAVRSFVTDLPEGTRVGLVSFGSYAQLNIALTDDHAAFLDTLDTMPLIRGTAIGEGLLKSLETFPTLELREAVETDADSLATIVLLSDGNNRSGIAPLEALEEVKKQAVTVHTVGIGTRTGTPGGFSAAGFDETTLQTIAQETGGRYVFVDSAEDLKEVYRALSRAVAWRWGRDEATALVALAAALALVISLGVGTFRRRVI